MQNLPFSFLQTDQLTVALLKPLNEHSSNFVTNKKIFAALLQTKKKHFIFKNFSSIFESI